MIDPKSGIYNLLKTIKDAQVAQWSSDDIVEFPAIRFLVLENRPVYELDNEMVFQVIEAEVNIWADDSVTTGTLLTEVEELLRGEGYLLQDARDFPDPDGRSRIIARFKLSIK